MPLIKSPADNNHYQLLKTQNNIKVLHVLDEDSTCCALALSVASGSFCDPKDCPGLAHLLEHVLFTGSEHFPVDNYILQFLDEHQGKINAWTSSESTMFYFKVHHKYFAQALNIFFDMLLHPLFKLEGIKKEINTIDAEFHNKVSEEQRRIMEVQKETCNQAHPFHRFAVGNAETFGQFSDQEIAARLRQYWQAHFVAEKLSVCLLTNQAQREELETSCQFLQQFPAGSVTNSQRSLPPLYLDSQLQRHLKITTHRNHHRVILIFNQTPELTDVPDTETLVSHLFGYEGEGSLLRYWKAQKWASQVIAGPGLKGSGFSDFNLYIELSEAGLAHLNEIIQSIFYYAQMIKSADDIERHYAEKAQLNKLAFEHRGHLNSLDFVQHLVKNLTQHPEQDILSGDYLLKNLDYKCLHGFLDNLVPERLRVLSISHQYQSEHHSKWYNVPYDDSPLKLRPLTSAQQTQLQDSVFLPPANPFIPAPKVCVQTNEELPQKLKTTNSNIWFGTETKESQSKGECFFSWRKDSARNTIEQVAHRKLYASTLESNLHHHFYQAQLAGLHFHFYAHQSGIGLHISGFADKQLMLARQLLEKVYTRPGDCPDFELHKQEYLNSLQSSIQNKPLNRLFTALQAIFVTASWLPEDLAKIVAETDLGAIQARHDAFFKDCFLESLVYGSWPAQQLTSFVTHLSALSDNTPKPQSNRQLVCLQEIAERSIAFHCEHPDAALVVYLQGEDKSLKSRARMMLCESMLAGFYFDRMRNKKQLGYQVGSGYMPFNEHPGTVLYIQSPVASAAELHHETMVALEHFQQWLSSMTQDQWQKYRRNLERQIKQKSINFSVKCQRYWGAIGREQINFNDETELNSTVASLTKEDVSHWFGSNYLGPEKSFALYSKGSRVESVDDFPSPLTNIYKYK